MTTWVYLFSKFTHEALLFEALVIGLLCSGYAAFWVLRKRRVGSAGETIPAGVIKTYLNHLIVDAEQLRMQLFGLLAAAGISTADAQRMTAGLSFGGATTQPFLPASDPAMTGTGPSLAAVAGSAATAGSAPAGDPAAIQKLAVLETKMAEQAKAMEAVIADKARIEKELEAAKTTQAAAGPAAAGASNDAATIAKLQEKIALLEGKLAEYNVIEDDLANLKRLQQENVQLKASLSAGGGKAPEPGPMPVVEAPLAAPTPEVEAAPPAAEAPPPVAAGDALFEGLVDQVEKSLEQPAAATPAEAAAPAAAVAASKSDEDLVAEFEKMLKG